MRKNKLLAFLLAVTVASSSFAVGASAETVEQDGLSVSYTTDKEKYSDSDSISVTLDVKNNNAGSVYDVQLDELVPEGYKLADGSLSYKSIAELKSGESQKLDTIFIKNGGGDSDASVPDSDDDSSNEDTSKNDESNNSSNSDSSSSNNSSSSNGSSSSAPGKSDENPATGENQVAIACLVLIIMIGTVIVSVKYGKGKKMFSFILVAAMLTTVFPSVEMKVDAVGTEIKVTTIVKVDGKDVSLVATVQYENVSSNPSEPSVAEEYYMENAEIIDVVDVSPEETLSEAEVTKFLNEKGFTDYPITYNYALSGEFNSDQESSSSSDVKHPMYGTYYISKNNEIWYVTVVGKDIFANPMSFNIQTERDIPTMLSMTNSIIGYDDEKNRLYTIIPKKTAMIVVEAKDINSEILDNLTIEEVGKL